MKKSETSSVSLDELLTRGVDSIYPSTLEIKKTLLSGKKFRLYQGFDPTGTQLHIGHTVALWKLRQFQQLGHEVIFLIGDGTGQAGDPSGKTTARDRFLTRDELRANARDYVHQASKIVQFDGPNPVKILYNGDWLNKLGLVEILNLAGHFSVQQLLERDMFQNRMKKGETINLREFLYPLLQGYDSVAMNVDLEIGGTDQTFNMLAGRLLVKAMLGKEKFVLTVPLLTDAHGKKIGKTEGNVIGITDRPNELFGKIMALADSVIGPAFELITPIPMGEVNQIKTKLNDPKTNPMEFKKKLAHTLVSLYHSIDEASKAQKYFEQTVQHRQLPMENVESFSTTDHQFSSVALKSGLVTSMSELKRLVKQGGVYINNERVTDINRELKDGDIIRRGSHRIVKVN